ncbi:MAG: ATP-binding protein, partial [Bdellovibrionota bacterium]
KYKSEFLANMSHELRTPLNSLLILSKTLADNKDENLTGEQVKFATTVHSAGQDLLALINEILDLSKVEAGKMPVNPKEVPTKEIQDYLEQTFRPVAEHKGLQFEIAASSALPKRLFTDENRLQQILKNLLSNAFKFTEKGSVKFSLGIADKNRRFALDTLNKSKNVIIFKVSDTGIGIPRDKQNMIFEAFQQADGTTSRRYGGTGLGLTISREIARLLGGVIEVESEVGEGSEFTLYLPQKYTGADAMMSGAVPETPMDVPLLPHDADFSGKKILVVDDDMRNIFALTSVMKQRGMSVVYAENGKDGLAVLKANPDVNLVLMDTMMPEMDGLEATREIRKMPEFLNLPIVSLTAKAMKGDREKCLEAGASDYVTKPVDEEVLLAVMYSWLKPQVQNALVV